MCMNAEGDGKGSKPAANNSMVNAVALFDKSGTLIYMGQSKGTITVLDTASLKFLDFVKVCSPPCSPAWRAMPNAARDAAVLVTFCCAKLDLRFFIP